MDAAGWVAVGYLLLVVAGSLIHHLRTPGPPRHAGHRRQS
jgi:hypothetical protein